MHKLLHPSMWQPRNTGNMPDGDSEPTNTVTSPGGNEPHQNTSSNGTHHEPVAPAAGTQTPTTSTVPSLAVETITPERAEQLLEGNTRNRKVKDHYVTQLADDMRNGRFVLNGDTIRVADDGVLLDGQHRLLACIRSQQPFNTVIVTGLPNDTMTTIDTGNTRTVGDVLGLNGQPFASIAASVTRLVMGWRRGDLYTVSHLRTISRAAVTEFAETHRDELTVAARTAHRAHVNIGGPTSAYGALYFETADHNTEFFDKLISGEGLRAGNPVLTTRNFMIRNARLTSIEALDILVSGWNSHVAGQTRHVVKRSKSAIPRPAVPAPAGTATPGGMPATAEAGTAPNQAGPETAAAGTNSHNSATTSPDGETDLTTTVAATRPEDGSTYAVDKPEAAPLDAR